jgi:hypothetical protein
VAAGRVEVVVVEARTKELAEEAMLVTGGTVGKAGPTAGMDPVQAEL